MGTVKERLAEIGVELPAAPAPVAAYVPYRVVPLGPGRAMVFVSGQIPIADGKISHVGLVPGQVGVEEARAAARLCAINILAQLEAAAGLERVVCLAQITGFVAAEPGFTDHPGIINAASELIASALGEAGLHTRAAVGAGSLPLGVPVEIAAVAIVSTD